MLISTHLTDILEEQYDIVSVIESGEEALLKVPELEPDLLLVDFQLTGELTGFEMIKELQKAMEVSVIYLTSNLDEEMKNKSKETQPLAFIQKPIDETYLLNTIEFSLNKAASLAKEKAKLVKKTVRYKNQIEELSETTKHLATATLRERDLKNKLQETLDELEESKKIIEKQNKSILDSINYAKRIQKAIIPKLEDIRADFPDTNWMYKPKDVVSGDFPYYFKKGDLIYYAAVDCTGHGVPGAMMSLIGHLLLNDILNSNTIYSPSEVLRKLHEGVVSTLKQDLPDNKAADGMDVGICCYNTKTKKLEYSGAHRPLYLVRKGEEIIQYKGGKYPVGGNQYKGANSYPNHEIDIKSGDTIYFFSDGYPDQFGGADNLKIGPKRIRRILEGNVEKTLDENIAILSDTFEDWMKETKQIDDVLLIGIKF